MLFFLFLVLFSCDTGTNTTGNNLNPDSTDTDPTGPLPAILHISPNTGVLPNDQLTITGTDLDSVSYALFTGEADKIYPTSISYTELKLFMPEMAQSGPILLVTKGGRIATVDIVTQKPDVNNFNSGAAVSTGENVTIGGTFFNLLASVLFSGSSSPVSVTGPTDGQYNVIVPSDAGPGLIKLIMNNGEIVNTVVNVTFVE